MVLSIAKFLYRLNLLSLNNFNFQKAKRVRLMIDTFFFLYAKLFLKTSPLAVNAGGAAGEWMIPDEKNKDRVILYFHGGGYVFGSITTHRDLVARAAKASKAKALSIGYRLAPENPFPAALSDAAAAYTWLLANGTSSEKIILMGDSAGGGLVVSLLHHLKNNGIPLPQCAVCICPWVDVSCPFPSMTENEKKDPVINPALLTEFARMAANGASYKDPGLSPIYGDFSQLPPLLIQVGTNEILLDDARKLAEKAKEQGVDVTLDIWEDMVHVWHLLSPILPEGKAAIEKIGTFICEKVPV